MFDKPSNEIDKADICRLVDEKVIEGVNIDFKESLPSKRQNDPWMESKKQISDYARNQLLEEVVAFANAYGGVLCIGISESEGTPACANGINALPDCRELAERLKLQCRDCIEPQIPLLDAIGVVTDEDGCGVVIIQIPQSRLAPHRHTITKECYIRRVDRTENMTMREIQDLTLHTERGMARIDASFNDQKSKFEEKLKFFREEASQKKCGIRITALPTNDIYLHNIHRCSDVKLDIPTFRGTLDGQSYKDLKLPYSRDFNWKPILRGTYTESISEDQFCSTELQSNGLVELVSFIMEDQQDPGYRIFPQWFMGMVCDSLNYLHRIRKTARTTSVEYALEVQVFNVGAELCVRGYSDTWREHQGRIKESNVTFPRYSVGTTDSFQELCSIVETDFWNHSGKVVESNIQIDFHQLQ